MDKTIKINLAGSLFQIDEDAYRKLKDYLLELNNHFRNTDGGAETIEDIESRIAELFNSQKSATGVIDKEIVESVISTLGNPSDFDVAGDTYEPAGSTSKRALYRNPEDRIIGGVCGGIGAYLNMEPVWIRILFILFALFAGIGFFVYLALWIALPSAWNENQKREMYGGGYHTGAMPHRRSDLSAGPAAVSALSGRPSSGAGNAINEIFKAIGRVFFIFLRIILILIGVAFILTGFLTLLTSVMVMFLKFPTHFSTDEFGVNLFYLPDFLDFLVNPALAPWILVLSFIVLALPMIALIYWGVKMIFWFRAKDGLISLAVFVLWILCVAALSIILFNEGISFAETGKTTSVEVLADNPGEIFIMSENRIEDLRYDKEITFPDGDYKIYFSGETKDIYIGTSLMVRNAEDGTARLEIRKRSSGRSNSEARRKAESLKYSFSFSGDTLRLDEYFTIPADNRWSIDRVSVHLLIPEGTSVKVDRSAMRIFDRHGYTDYESDYENTANRKPGIWVMTEDGLKPSSLN